MLETLIRWGAYLGGWLLVAGPLLQSRLELERERSHLAEVREAVRATAPPSRPSAVWWLFPPAALYLARQRQSAYVATLTTVLTPAQLANLARYFAVARAWMIVAAGAALIALKETFELAHHMHWGTPGFWALAAVALLCIAALNGAASAYSDHRDRRH
ncbi:MULTISPECIES: hypothetical protein [Tsukamurella]|uniref:Uncharacterized protein n=2 Tax=Tsukamurella TaxID=2060 RepID=A0A5C5S1V8_9ACTN|nr:MULTISPECIES: hypothetical protein [Tsukamurella]NMD54423.1 hypothetical protein [Tsukamurella columbiensis]TWS28892.1 hypothetical protein FK530_11980 [Tsukamurella conjunctivitidis]